MKYWEVWIRLVNSIINAYPTNDNKNLIATHLHSLMKEVALKSQVHFIAAFHDLFLDRHMMFLQHKDEKTKEAGFISVHLPVRIYIMHKEVMHVAATWRQSKVWSYAIKFQIRQSKILAQRLFPLYFLIMLLRPFRSI